MNSKEIGYRKIARSPIRTRFILEYHGSIQNRAHHALPFRYQAFINTSQVFEYKRCGGKGV